MPAKWNLAIWLLFETGLNFSFRSKMSMFYQVTTHSICGHPQFMQVQFSFWLWHPRGCSNWDAVQAVCTKHVCICAVRATLPICLLIIDGRAGPKTKQLAIKLANDLCAGLGGLCDSWFCCCVHQMGSLWGSRVRPLCVASVVGNLNVFKLPAANI